MKIVTLGPAGTFSHEATERIFPDVPVTFAPNFDAVFDALIREPETIGVVPIENSLHGSVDEILDLLRDSEVRVWRMHDIAIRHACGAQDPATVKTVASHSQALRQCRLWLREHHPLAEYLSTTSTAAAVKLAQSDPTVAAIASPVLIKKSGLTIIGNDVQGENNTTRFGIVSVCDPFPGSPRTQMSIAIHPKTTHHRPGFLHRLITPFKVYDINLTRVENRPTGKKIGDYNFFIDFVGSPDDPRTRKVLEELEELATVRVLGEW